MAKYEHSDKSPGIAIKRQNPMQLKYFFCYHIMSIMLEMLIGGDFKYKFKKKDLWIGGGGRRQ